ncbi:hypothetical protein D3C83_01710 [compost metagenome]
MPTPLPAASISSGLSGTSVCGSATRSRLARRSASARAASMAPSRAANISAVQPPRGNGELGPPLRGNSSTGASRIVERASIAAPAATSRRTTPAWFSAAAHISAVSPNQRSRTLTSAPASMRRLTVAATPVRAAVMITGSPASVAAFGSAPAFSSRATSASLPLVAASVSGRTP